MKLKLMRVDVNDDKNKLPNEEFVAIVQFPIGFVRQPCNAEQLVELFNDVIKAYDPDIEVEVK